MNTLQWLKKEALVYTFTAHDLSVLERHAAKRAAKAEQAIQGGMAPKYQANSTSGHLTGIAGELAVQRLLQAELQAPVLVPANQWDLEVLGMYLDVKTWPMRYLDRAGNSVNADSCRQLVERQRQMQLPYSVVPLVGLERAQDKTPTRAYWYGWATSDQLHAGTVQTLSIHGRDQVVRSISWTAMGKPRDFIGHLINEEAAQWAHLGLGTF